MKFMYLVVPSIVVETAFSLYLENNASFLFQIWQHRSSQPEQPTSYISTPGHCPFNYRPIKVFLHNCDLHCNICFLIL